MKIEMSIVCLTLLSITQNACTTPQPARPKGEEINASMVFRSKAERRRTEQKAIAGDAEAAKRLADCSFFVDHDLASAERWYKLAASYGDKDAKVSLKTVQDARKEQRR